MWVRSQDKTTLVNAGHFEISPVYEMSQEKKGKRESKMTDKCLIVCEKTILGIYKTKEKALNVLDDIETYMFNHGALGLSYQMPQDSEVE